MNQEAQELDDPRIKLSIICLVEQRNGPDETSIITESMILKEKKKKNDLFPLILWDPNKSCLENLLPTAQNLWKKKLGSPSKPLLSESMFHALLTCKASQKLWRLTPFE